MYLKQYCHSSAHLHAGKGIANGKTLPTALYTEITLITEEPEKKVIPFLYRMAFLLCSKYFIMEKECVFIMKLYMLFPLSFQIFSNVRIAQFYKLFEHFAFVVNLA